MNEAAITEFKKELFDPIIATDTPDLKKTHLTHKKISLIRIEDTPSPIFSRKVNKTRRDHSKERSKSKKNDKYKKKRHKNSEKKVSKFFNTKTLFKFII